MKYLSNDKLDVDARRKESALTSLTSVATLLGTTTRYWSEAPQDPPGGRSIPPEHLTERNICSPDLYFRVVAPGKCAVMSSKFIVPSKSNNIYLIRWLIYN